MLKTIFFDFGDTLVDSDILAINCYKSMIREILKTYNKSENPVQYIPLAKKLMDESFIERNKQFGFSDSNLKHSEKSDQFMIRTLSKKLVKEIGQDKVLKSIVERVYKAFFEGLTTIDCLFPETRKTLSDLRSKYQLGIISDQMIEAVIYPLRKLGLIDFFDAITISAEAGVTKPHPKMFTDALKRTGTKPAESMMVGDTLKSDVLGANNMGMTSVWVNRNNKPLTGDSIKPDYIVKNLSELDRICSEMEK